MDSVKHHPISVSPMKNRPGDILISTKLHMPPMKPKMLPRKHLVDRLSEGKDRRLVVVSGVAGSGKTSLVCQWITRNRLTTVWYSLDKTDNESDLFFRYLLSALTGLDDQLSQKIGSWLERQDYLSGKEIIPFLIKHLVNLTQDIYLVLDDYHLIQSGEIHDALSYLLDYIPPRLHIVLISRYAIPISLGHFRVRGQIVEIPASDMRFTEEETARFFEEIIPVSLSVEEVHDLARYTEGWVGGLQLLGLSLKEKHTPHNLKDILNRARHETADYLVDEVLQAQPVKIRSFLETTALLDRFNADLCREITGSSDVPEMLDHLYRNNLFLVPLDGEHTWYRYHHLLSEIIRKQIKTSSPAMFCNIQRRAALWFAEKGLLEDAFRHAFSSEDPEFAADLLEEYLLFIPDRSGYSSGLRWIAKVPYHILNQRALLGLHDCAQKAEGFRFAEVEELLRGIETRLPEAFERYDGFKKTLCRDLFTYLSYMVRYYYRGPKKADVERLSEACGVISQQNKQLAGYIRMFVALRYLMQGDLIMADKTLKDATAVTFTTESTLARILWYRFSAVVERTQGRLHSSEAILAEAFEMLDRKGLSDTPLKLLLHLPMAWLSYYRNDIDHARELAAAAVQHGERAEFARDVVDGGMLLAFICLAEGNMDGAEEFVEKTRQVVKTFDTVEMEVSLDAWTARLSMLRGDLASALEWAQQRRVSLDEPFSLRLVDECMTQAELWFRQGLYRETADMLRRLRVLCKDRNLMLAVLEADILYSATLYALNDYNGAKLVLEQALQFAETEKCMRPFANLVPIVSPLLLEMTRQRREDQGSSFLHTITKSCGIAAEHVNQDRFQAGGIRDLTTREVEILALMAAGYRNKEIAKKTFVSHNTIKSHIQHIFEKLNVTNRSQAIRYFLNLNISSR